MCICERKNIQKYVYILELHIHTYIHIHTRFKYIYIYLGFTVLKIYMIKKMTTNFLAEVVWFGLTDNDTYLRNDYYILYTR